MKLFLLLCMLGSQLAFAGDYCNETEVPACGNVLRVYQGMGRDSRITHVRWLLAEGERTDQMVNPAWISMANEALASDGNLLLCRTNENNTTAYITMTPEEYEQLVFTSQENL